MEHLLLHSTYSFLKCSPLKNYILRRYPNFAPTFTLFALLTCMKNTIRDEFLFDEKNPAIIMCDEELDTALEVSVLHVTQVREKTLNHLKWITCPREILLLISSIPPLPSPLRSEKTVSPLMLYILPNDFRKVLSTLEGFPYRQYIFTFREICMYVSDYIVSKSEVLFDPRNLLVCVVMNDPLGKALNVNAFHRCQVTQLIKKNIICVQ